MIEPYIDRRSERLPGSGSLSTLALLLAVAALCILGLLMLYSVGRSHDGGSGSHVIRQSVWMVIAWSALLITWRIPLEPLRRCAWGIGIVSLALLIVVLIPGIGVMVNGARRWIDLGPVHMQVSDFAKIGMIFVLAHYLAANQRNLKAFWCGYAVPCGMIGLVFILVLLQPDFGTALLCALVGAAMLFLAGARMAYLVPSAIAGVAFFATAVFHDPVRLRRILVFLDAEGNRTEGAYQLWQAMLAFGVGGWTGVGIGNGRQQLAFLPEAHTDFIFPIVGEELGLIFSALVVILFLVIFTIIVIRLRAAPNLFHFLLVFGAMLAVTLQALTNLGVATGLLPTKGLSLPFVSYGGSNLLATFILLGLILNCFRQWERGGLNRAKEVAA